MAQVAGTTDTYGSKGLREDLQNAINMISPHDTPGMSNIGKGRATSTRTDWQTDALAAADTANAQIQGDDYSFAARAPTTRVGNITQISRKPVIVSRTLEAVDKAGRDSEVRYQVAKAGLELRKDMEAIMFGTNQASLVGNSTTASKLGSFATWLTSNASRGATGANGGYSTGTSLTVAATDGTQRAFTETMVKDVQQSCFTSGGNPRIIMMPPGQKRVFSAFAGIAVNRIEYDGAGKNKPVTIVAAADTYLGDFGTLTAVPNRWMRTREAFMIDPKMASVLSLRPMTIDKVANTGDAEKRMLIVEYTLCVKNEAAHGVIADLT